jgi:hypothetical protein
MFMHSPSYVHMHINIYRSTYIYACIHIQARACAPYLLTLEKELPVIFERINISVLKYTYVSIYVCVHIFSFTKTFTHIYTYKYVYIYTYTG